VAVVHTEPGRPLAGRLTTGLRGASKRVGIWSLGIAATLVVWVLGLELTDTPSYLAAGPAVAFEAMIEERALILDGLRITMIEAGVGLAVSTTLALLLAALFVTLPTAERAMMPMALVFRSVPVVAIAPLIVLMVGRGLSTSVICVTIVTFFPVLVLATRGFRSLAPEMLELFRVHGATTSQIFRHARIPNAIPFIFTGLRVAAAKGVLGAMLAEWLTGSEGLGYLLVFASSRRQIGLLWATLVVATVSAIVIFQTTVAAERALQRRVGVGEG